MRWRFRSLALALPPSIVAGGLAGMVAGPLGTLVFVVALATCWTAIDAWMR